MRYQRGLCLGKTARPPAPCGSLKNLAHIFIATQSQQRPHADSSIEPRDIRVEFGYETCSHNVSPMPLVFPVRISRLEDLHQGQFAILPPYTPECLADSFIANTSGCPQKAVNWAVPQDLTSDVHDSNASYERYAASAKDQLAIQFEPTCLPDSSTLPPAHSSSFAPSTKQEHLTRGVLSHPSYQSSNSQPTHGNHSAILRELF